jgi:hypothetical protein
MYKGLNFILWLFWIYCMNRIWIQQTVSSSIQYWSHLICFLYTLKCLSVFILAKALKSRVGVFYMPGWNRVRWISRCPRNGDNSGFHREHEFSSSDFTSILSNWADSSRVTQAVREMASPLSWLQLSVRIFVKPYYGIIWVFPEHRFPWIVVGITHKGWQCANIPTWR